MSQTPPIQPPPLNLDSVSAPPLVDDAADVRLAKEEQRFFEKERKRVELQGLIDDQEARKKWGDRIFWLIAVWLGADFLCVCWQGFTWNEFHVSDSIILTLIGTTTVNVLGLGYIVAHYLFPKSSSSDDDTRVG